MRIVNDLLYVCNIIINAILSHLRSKEFKGIHKSYIPGLFRIPRVHLEVDQ